MKIPVDPLPSTNTLVPPMLIAIDDEDSVFPHDRISPEEMIDRLNGKYKNKISDISDSNSDNEKPNIEVSGSLPPETYDIRLKTSSHGELTPSIGKFDDEIKYTSAEPNFPLLDEEDEQPVILTGVGVAEPVLESELGKQENYYFYCCYKNSSSVTSRSMNK